MQRCKSLVAAIAPKDLQLMRDIFSQCKTHHLPVLELRFNSACVLCANGGDRS
jgi:hypothetical protein